jgi:hypothetical protein
MTGRPTTHSAPQFHEIEGLAKDTALFQNENEI